MKKILLAVVCAFASILAHSQVTAVRYFLKYDTTSCKYDVYLKVVEGSGSNLVQFNAQISVVVPFGTEVEVLRVDNFNPRRANNTPAIWSVTTNIQGPTVTPNLSYFSIVPTISPTATYASLAPGSEVRLFALTLTPAPPNNCGDYIRLWNNNNILGRPVTGGDPGSTAPGMEGGNFNNGFTIALPNQRYIGNDPKVLPIQPILSTQTTCNSGIEIDLNARVPACQSPLTYSWTGPNGYSSTNENVTLPNADASATGLYTVITTDALGCKDTISIEAQAKPRAGQDVSGCAGNLPTLTGTNPATGTWTSGSSLVTIGSTSGGVASVTAIDPAANSAYDLIYTSGVCSDTARIAVGGADAGPNISPIACNLNGVADLAAVGTGVWSLAAVSSGTAVFGSTNNATTTLSQFSLPGTYLAVWSVGACTDTLRITVGSDCSCPIGSNTISIPNVEICGIPSSYIITGGSATPAGGTYQWQVSNNSGPFVNAPGTSNTKDYTVPQTLTAGNFTYKRIYTIGAPSNCSGESAPATLTVLITPSPPTITTPSPLSICLGQEATVSAQVIPGASFNWSASATGLGLATSTTNSVLLTPTAAGSYTLSVTASSGICTSTPTTVAVKVSAAPPTPTNVVGTNPTACQGSNGSILINGLSTSTSYTVSYSKNGVSVPAASITSSGTGSLTINNLTAGNYSNFTIAIGTCSVAVNNTITLSDPNAPSAPTNLTAIPSSVCTGQTINLSATGATGVTGASFLWSVNPATGAGLGTSTTNSNTMTPGSQGNFTISVSQNVGGCISPAATTNITVSSGPSTPTASTVVPTVTSSCGGSDGRITVSGLTPNVNLKLTYTFGGNVVTANVTSDPSGRAEILNLIAGDYSNFIVEDANGCRSGAFAGPVRISDPNTSAPEVSVIPNPVCLSEAVTFTALGRTGATYNWTSPSPNLVIPAGSTTGVIRTTPTAVGTYIISVTQSSNGCTSPAGTITLIVRNCSNSKIGDFVWNDANANGIQNAGELGIKDVTVSLFREDDVLLQTTITDAAGKYTFNDVESGRYYLKFAGTTLQTTLPNVGTDENVDSDITNRFGPKTTDIITIIAGEDQLNVDAGFYRCNRIGNLVWYDVNKNDVWDVFENGLNGIKVNLWRTDGGKRLWATTLTGKKPGSPSDDGWWEFCAPNGTYYVEFILPPTGLVTARPNIGGNELTDSDIVGIPNGPGTTASFTLNNQNKLDIGAGYYPMATAGNLVWFDENFNGFQDAEEPRLANVKIEAYDVETNEIVGEAVTNTEGVYKIEYLKMQEVYFKMIPPSGYSATIRTQEDNYNSDIDHSFGPNTTRSISMTPGEENQDIDFGLALGALPLKWEYIVANNLGDDHAIEWKTNSELNVAYFVVERIAPGAANFEVVSSKIKARNEFYKASTYSFLDKNVGDQGVYTYRVVQYDFDGSSSISDLAEVERKQTAGNELKIYPNPVNNQLQIDISIDRETNVTSELYNMLGQKLSDYTIQTKLNEGSNKLSHDLSKLTPGLYQVRIAYNGNVTWREIIKQ
jgi:hypothetical protein